MGRDEDGDAAVGSVVDELPEAVAGIGIHTAGGLVKEDDGRMVEDGYGEGQPLFPPEGHRPHEGVAFGRHVELHHQFFGAPGDVGGRHSVDAPEETEVFLHREVVVEGKALAHVADAALQGFGFRGHVAARHHRPSVGREGEAGEHTHCRGFARTICSEKTEDFTPPHLEGDVVAGGERAKLLGEPFGHDDWLCVVGTRACGEGGFGRQHLGRIAHSRHLPFGQQCNASAEGYLLSIGRTGHDSEPPLAVEAGEHRPEFAARHRVDPRGGLVEQKEARCVDEGAAEGELLLHAAREFAGRPVSEGCQLVVDVADEGIIFRYAHPKEVGKEVEIFGHGEVAIEGERARHVADGAAQAAIGAHHVLPVHDRRAAGGQEEGGEDAEEGRLARAVRPDEAEHFSLLDVDVDAAEGVDAAVVVGFGELSDGDEGHDFFFVLQRSGYCCTAGGAKRTSPYMPRLMRPSLRTRTLTA